MSVPSGYDVLCRSFVRSLRAGNESPRTIECCPSRLAGYTRPLLRGDAVPGLTVTVRVERAAWSTPELAASGVLTADVDDRQSPASPGRSHAFVAVVGE